MTINLRDLLEAYVSARGVARKRSVIESVGKPAAPTKRGRGRPKITEQRPWEAEGISNVAHLA